jgi:hypothetical protein
MTRIVDLQGAPPVGGRRLSLAPAAVAIVLLVFAATLEPVQRTARAALWLAGLAPLAVTMSGIVADEDGAPIMNAFVRVDQGGKLATTYTDEQGKSGSEERPSPRSSLAANKRVHASDARRTSPWASGPRLPCSTRA